MADERGGAPTIHGPGDIRNLTAKFNTGRGAHFAVIRGADGYISAGGAKVAFFSRWVVRHVGQKPDGKPTFRFQAQFRWKNDVMMNMIATGKLRGRVILQMMTKRGRENVDILGWAEWRYEDGILYLEDIYQTEGAKFRPIDR